MSPCERKFRARAHLAALHVVIGQFQYIAEKLGARESLAAFDRINREQAALERSFLQQRNRGRVFGLGCNDTPADDLRTHGEGK